MGDFPSPFQVPTHQCLLTYWSSSLGAPLVTSLIRPYLESDIYFTACFIARSPQVQSCFPMDKQITPQLRDLPTKRKEKKTWQSFFFFFSSSFVLYMWPTKCPSIRKLSVYTVQSIYRTGNSVYCVAVYFIVHALACYFASIHYRQSPHSARVYVRPCCG